MGHPHLAGEPCHVDSPLRLARTELDASAGGGAVGEERDRALARMRLYFARADEGDGELRRDLAVMRLRRLPGVRMRVDHEALGLARGDGLRAGEAQVGRD